MLSWNISISTKSENVDLDSTSTCYSKFYVSWIPLLSVMLVLSITGPQGRVGKYFCLYFHLFSCPIICIFFMSIFNFYQSFTMMIWTAVSPFIPSFLCPGLCCCIEFWIIIAQVLREKLISTATYTFASFTVLYYVIFSWRSFISTNAAIWSFGQHFYLLSQFFFFMHYFVLHNLGSLYRWSSRNTREVCIFTHFNFA